MKVAILDDYQNVALQCADWTGVSRRAEITVFNDHVADAEALVARLRPYDVLAVMRERTPLRRDIIERLPNLKMIASNAPRNASIDLAAAAERGIILTHSSYSSTPTVELTWALILAGARHITAEAAAVRDGKWQHTIGEDMAEKTLGIVGLGSIGARVAKVAQAFGMNVIAWSQNLTAEKAAAGGALVVEAALIEALSTGKIAGAAIDVYDIEPLPLDHPFRKIDRLLATPHIGYVSRGLYERFYRDMAANIATWLESQH